MIDDCTAVILAGGDSRRMGRDKSALMLGDKTLLQHVENSVAQVFPHVMVSVRQARADLTLPQVFDEQSDGGPLAGLAAALEQMEFGWVFAVACDMPFIAPALLEFLAEHRAGHQAVVPVVQGHPQPLAAFYSRDCLPVIRDMLVGSGRHSLRALLERLDVCYINEAQLREHDAQLRSFFDLDTPADFAVASNGVN